MTNSSFYEWAAKMGHDIAALDAGEEISTEIIIINVDSLKALLQDLHRLISKRAEEAILIFGELPPADDKTQLALQQKVNHFVYGDYEMPAEDKQAANATLFPMKIWATSAKEKTIDEPLIVGSPDQRRLLNYETLNISGKGKITIESEEVDIHIGTLLCMGDMPATMGDFNILGARGATGAHGDRGTDGPDGSRGEHGGIGVHGTIGKDGSPSRNAIINISRSIQSNRPIVVYTMSGPGGDGGNGGNGGNGGISTNTRRPERAGNGGNGGNGAAGGKGVPAIGNIMVYVPHPHLDLIIPKPVTAPAGAGGRGGKGGNPGASFLHPRPINGQEGLHGTVGAMAGKPAEIHIRPY